MKDVIVRRRRNDSGFISDWVIIDKEKVVGDLVKDYWTADLSYGVVIEPWHSGSLALLMEDYEMEETPETFKRAMDEAVRQTKQEIFG